MVFLVLNRKMLVRAAEKHITPLRIERYTFNIAGVCVCLCMNVHNHSRSYACMFVCVRVPCSCVVSLTLTNVIELSTSASLCLLLLLLLHTKTIQHSGPRWLMCIFIEVFIVVRNGRTTNGLFIFHNAPNPTFIILSVSLCCVCVCSSLLFYSPHVDLDRTDNCIWYSTEWLIMLHTHQVSSESALNSITKYKTHREILNTMGLKSIVNVEYMSSLAGDYNETVASRSRLWFFFCFRNDKIGTRSYFIAAKIERYVHMILCC